MRTEPANASYTSANNLMIVDFPLLFSPTSAKDSLGWTKYWESWYIRPSSPKRSPTAPVAVINDVTCRTAARPRRIVVTGNRPDDRKV